MGYRRGTFFSFFFLRVKCLCFVELTFIYTLFIPIQCILGNKHFNTYMRYEHQFLSVATYSTQTNVVKLNLRPAQNYYGHHTAVCTLRASLSGTFDGCRKPVLGVWAVCSMIQNKLKKHTQNKTKTNEEHTVTYQRQISDHMYD